MSERYRGLMDTPTPTTKGPWPKAVLTEDGEAWSHWIRRPCGDCGHAFLDHDNNIFENTQDCRHCDCRSFAEPDHARS